VVGRKRVRMYFDPSEPGAAFRAADRLAARLMPHTRLVCASRKRTKKKNRKSWNHPITVKGVPALSVVFQMSLAFSETVRVTCYFSYSSIVPLVMFKSTGRFAVPARRAGRKSPIENQGSAENWALPTKPKWPHTIRT